MRYLKSILIFLFLLNVDAIASDVACSILSKKLVDEYLNSINSTAFIFSQTKSDKTTSGILLIKRPNKFRVNYDKDHPILIVGNKNFVSIYDYELEELSRIESKDNFFDLLMKSNISTSTSGFVMDSCEENAEEIIMDLNHPESTSKTTLVFLKNPARIVKIIMDSEAKDEERIYIDLTQEILLSKIQDELFIIKNPNISGPPERLSSEEILKILDSN
jgi:outer membrane lipoprotein-sorting protein